MHMIFRESHSLDDADVARDLEQTPAEMVVLSFSDSDLSAFQTAWHHSQGGLPNLRLANLSTLRHPLSIDVYCDQTLLHAKAVLIRVNGGESYWDYGVQRISALARQHNITLAFLSGSGYHDPRLDQLSTVDTEVLNHLSTLCVQGGRNAAYQVLYDLAQQAGLPATPLEKDQTPILPDYGYYCPEKGVFDHTPPAGESPCVFIVFYRSYLRAADTAHIDRLIKQCRDEGYDAWGLFVPSLKKPKVAEWVRGQIMAHDTAPFVMNTTAFSARNEQGQTPFDASPYPVFQLTLSSANRAKWQASDQGLSPSDLAMYVVLPEVDGRLNAGVVSFKEQQEKDSALQFSALRHDPDPLLIYSVIQQMNAWRALAHKSNAAKKITAVLSVYPGKAWQMAHAVGMDPLQSMEGMIEALRAQGYHILPPEDLAGSLQQIKIKWSVETYQKYIQDYIPAGLQADLASAWGDPQNDPYVNEGCFEFSAVECGNLMVALQPERGIKTARDDDYHDVGRTPTHSYVAFYLWVKHVYKSDALIHMGTHGTLEWLPGKSVALSDHCWPKILAGNVPILYPFIVNDPGEAVQAKRRIQAVTIGHMPPPLSEATLPDKLLSLEKALDEYSTADGLDSKRQETLVGFIQQEALNTGLSQELGIDPNSTPTEALVRIDRFVCDLKESQFSKGLHVFGQGQFGEHEKTALLNGLKGKRLESGPAGSPYRGRTDVFPTGRNLYAIDPRAVPSPTAYAQGVTLGEELIRQHLQEEGCYPSNLVINLWGSASIRTAGEDFAMALHLAGVKPTWAKQNDQISGFEIIGLAFLKRPRIDVTLRVSGLFRDLFPDLTRLFHQVCASLAERDEPVQENPYSVQQPRVFGPKEGFYGVGAALDEQDYSQDAKRRAGENWLASSKWVLGDSEKGVYEDQSALEDRVLQADGFVHTQDLTETDILFAADYAHHEGGFAAAVDTLGGAQPALYHLDTTNPNQPRARLLSEEITRVIHARASNPDWLCSMQGHGFRGAAEIAATLDHMAMFAHLSESVADSLFDTYFQCTLGTPDIRDFLKEKNPDAFDRMLQCFEQLREQGHWKSKHNSMVMTLLTLQQQGVLDE